MKAHFSPLVTVFQTCFNYNYDMKPCSLVDKKCFRRIGYLHLQSQKDYHEDESSRYLRNDVSCIPNYIFFYPEDGDSRSLWNVGTY
jgi:hypothetical protein